MRAHTRQFVIGPEPHDVPDWVQTRLGDVWLSRDPLLPLNSETLGVALGLDRERSPGRYIVFGGEHLELDACGTFGCFYRQINDRVWVSSSVALLRRLSPALPAPRIPLAWNGPLETVPPPLSGVDGIMRLLPSQVLDVRTGEITRRPLLSGAPVSYEQALDEIEQILRAAVSAIGPRPVWLPLTSGSDSRLLLAVCIAEGVPVTTYTFRSSRIDEWDLRMPPKVAEAAGVEHRLIEPQGVDPDINSAFAEHTDGLTVDMDSEFVPRHQWDEIPADAIVLGGSVWEVARCYYHRKQPYAPPEWFAWPTEEGLDWRDRLYIEQRVGGWLASFEQGVDFTGRTRVHLANSRRLLTVMLGIDEEKRRDGIHQRDVLRRLAPQLARFPVNRRTTARDRLRARVNRERDLLRYHGALRAYGRARIRRIREQH